MSRTRVVQQDWSWGELSSDAYGRQDLVQFSKSARELRNYRPMELGGVTRRAGTRFVAEAKFSDRPTAITPFVFAQGEAYVVELADQAFRFYRNGARIDVTPGVPLEVATPYLAADLFLLKFAQSFDVLYIAHNLYAPRRLERWGNLIWKLRAIHDPSSGSYGVAPPPSYEYGTRPLPGGILTLSATMGLGVTFTCAVPGVFRESDAAPPVGPGREILIVNGPNIGSRARIVTYVDAQHVTADILEPFVGVGPIPAANWKITRSPLAQLTPGGVEIGENVTLTLDINGWRTNDAIKFVRVNGGLVELNNFGLGPFDPKVVSGTVRVKLANVTPARAGAWSHEEVSWSNANGYPAAVVLGRGRSWWAGTLAQPTTVWGSVSSDFENFAAGVLDDDSVTDLLVSGQLNSILWLAMTDRLFAGTRGDIFEIKGGAADDLITPTSIDARPAVSFGARPEAVPLSIGPALVYPTSSGRKLREVVFDVLQARQLAPDLLLLANHLTKPLKGRLGSTPRGIRRTAYQREPISTIWAVSDSGEWDCCTYLRDQNVVAWSPMETAGILLDVAVVPKENGTGDRVWLLVQRTIGGVTKVFHEYLSDDDDGVIYDRLYVDCATVVDGIGRSVLTLGAGADTPGTSLVFPAAAAEFEAADVGRQLWQVPGPGRAVITAFTDTQHVTATVDTGFTGATLEAGTWGRARQAIAGLDHLEGATVVVSGDGSPQPTQVVVGGTITADAFAVGFEVGLGYVSKLVPHRPPTAGGKVNLAEAKLRVQDSRGLKVNGRRVTMLEAALYSGLVPVGNLVDERMLETPLIITQDQPMPSTILYLEALVEVGAA